MGCMGASAPSISGHKVGTIRPAMADTPIVESIDVDLLVDQLLSKLLPLTTTRTPGTRGCEIYLESSAKVLGADIVVNRRNRLGYRY